MKDENQPTALPPLLTKERASGLLLHVTSLPSPYGVGDLGRGARAWIDRLHQAGQTLWQVLPLGPLGDGNSPYQPPSSFAGNWLLISPDDLIADGLLRESELAGQSFPEATVDYDAVISFKKQLLETVATHFEARAPQELKLAFEKFRDHQSHWLDDYALFRALHAERGGVYYLQWPMELVQRNARALARARRKLASEIDRVRLAQFLVFRQLEQLKQYARARGVRLIGDLPFFVSPDSSDVWVNPELFVLDQQHRPIFVGGVPPDYFSQHGQLWGNPVYDWETLRRTGYRWCIDRIRALLAHVDLIRLDHFRAFAAAWHIPAAAATAEPGQWVPGPGADFFRAVQKDLGGLPFIAEDLGLITPDVRELRDQFQLAGTSVLQFAFDGMPDNPYLPNNYVDNTVVYTGTHDNNTTRGWYETLPDDQRNNLWRLLGRSGGKSSEAAPELMRLAWSSVAVFALAPLQDLLNLAAEARMNVPGLAGGNWHWRCTEEMLSSTAFDWLADLTQTSHRLPRQI